MERATVTTACLQDAFWQLYKTKPIHKITIKELSEKAGVHCSSFYMHYEDIYALRQSCEDELLHKITDYMDFAKLKKEGLSPLRVILTFYEDHLDQVSLLMGPQGDPAFLSRLRQTIVPVLCQYLGMEQDQEAIYMLDFMIMTQMTFLTNYYTREKHMPPLDILKKVHQILMNGFAAPLSEHAHNKALLEQYLHYM